MNLLKVIEERAHLLKSVSTRVDQGLSRVVQELILAILGLVRVDLGDHLEPNQRTLDVPEAMVVMKVVVTPMMMTMSNLEKDKIRQLNVSKGE